MKVKKRKKKIYSNIRAEDMILRDYLAYDRTVIANERTLLAYFRRALMLFATGVTLFKLIKEVLYQYIGLFFIAISSFVFMFGLVRYFMLKNKLNRIYSDK